MTYIYRPWMPRKGMKDRAERQAQNEMTRNHQLKLEWHYGPDRAFEIMKGRDEQTERDKAAWQSLGLRKEG